MFKNNGCNTEQSLTFIISHSERNNMTPQKQKQTNKKQNKKQTNKNKQKKSKQNKTKQKKPKQSNCSL